jgi:hypothetical protein
MGELKEVPRQEPVIADEVAVPAKKRRIVRIVVIGVGTIILCPILIYYGRIWIPRAWGSLPFVNYLVAAIPTILSILFAFVIDKDLEHHVRRIWRFGIVACGILYSLMLWHQQALTDKSNLDTQTRIVSDAVGQANKHSDEQIGNVRHDVQGVKTDLGGLKKDLQQSTSDITSGLGKIGTPPTKLARLQFSLFAEHLQIPDLPLLNSTMMQSADGTVPIDFIFTNTSDITAEGGEIWLSAGDDSCAFAVEPPGSDRPVGMSANQRHFALLGSINAGVSFQKTSVKVKCTMLPPYNLLVLFRYSCKTCGPMSQPQNAIVTVAPYTPLVLRN